MPATPTWASDIDKRHATGRVGGSAGKPDVLSCRVPTGAECARPLPMESMISGGDLTVVLAAVGVVVAFFFAVRHYVRHAEAEDGPDSNHQSGA